MIETIEGDLLDFPNGLHFIAHGCNTLGKMKSGLAAQMVARYPGVAKVDKLAVEWGGNVLGSISVACVDEIEERYVINIYQQNKLRELNILALEKGLEKALGYPAKRLQALRKQPISQRPVDWDENSKIGIPYKIGCGLAQGDWVSVLSLLNEMNDKYDGRLVIVKRAQDN